VSPFCAGALSVFRESGRLPWCPGAAMKLKL
jgi:hypothetical protein